MVPRRQFVLSALAAVTAARGQQAPREEGVPPRRRFRKRPLPPGLRDREGRLKPGDPAPDFELKILKSDQTVRLSNFHGKRPVALVFGSYT